MQPPATSLIKVTLYLRPDSIEKLGRLARQFGRAHRTDANAFAIDLAHFLAERIGQGDQVLLRSPDESDRQLIFPQ